MERLISFMTALSLFFAVAGSAMAQSASTSMKSAGHDIENAAANAYHGTKTGIKDTDVTAKVKLALHNDKTTKGRDIHVKTVAGIVTLSGDVPSSNVAARAEKLARGTTGVKSVRNELKVSTAGNGG
jgi:hyperosmotically inducible periplasmic protein